MRRTLGLALALAFLGGAVALAANGSDTRTRVACFNSHHPTAHQRRPDFRFEPHHCFFQKRGEIAYRFAVDARHIQWAHWGARKAKGHGIRRLATRSHTRVLIRLRHPVHACARVVFAKVHFRYPEFGTGDTWRLDTCASIAPQPAP